VKYQRSVLAKNVGEHGIVDNGYEPGAEEEEDDDGIW